MEKHGKHWPRPRNCTNEADQASMESERYALASTILTIGLGATAWAGLLREQNTLRFVFAVTAWVSLIGGLIVGFAVGG